MVRTLNEMSKQGLRADAVTYNLLLSYLCKNRNTTEVRKIFDSIIEKGIQPNVTTYSSLLNGYASKGDLADMHDLLDLRSYGSTWYFT